jgi:hypothetical protein
MNPILALALSTPVWGFSLTPPVLATPDLSPETAGDVVTVTNTELLDRSADDVAAEARNQHLMNWTRALSVSTTFAMAVTGVFGFVQFHDEYGFHDEYAETNCGRGVQGDPVFSYCGEATPVPHLLGAGASAVALFSTVGVSTQIDFDRAARRDGDWRTYETTRWIALGLGLAQALGGAFLANSERLGVFDYESDFDVMQGFAVAHMALGAANVGMNLANSILLF